MSNERSFACWTGCPRFHDKHFLLRLPLLIVLVCTVSASAQAPPRPQKKGDKTAAPAIATTPAEVARGKYIVENVAMCPQCHTPRDGNDALDHAHELEGASEFFQPPHPAADWPLKAPRIGGNPQPHGRSEEHTSE